MSQGGHSEQLLFFALVIGGVGGPWDFSVSPSSFGLDFGTLDFGLGLDNILQDDLCTTEQEIRCSQSIETSNSTSCMR